MPLINVHNQTYPVHKNVQAHVLELELKNRLMIETLALYLGFPREKVESDIDGTLHDFLDQIVESQS